MEDQVELVTRPTSSTQFYLFNLFADYIVPRGGGIWTNDLLYLLSLLGVSERAARTTLSRMKKKGWFVTRRLGRQSQYVITERGKAILAEGDKRIFEEPLTDWDGQWHLVVYSLPEAKRNLRNEFRKKLFWFGFGNLAPGTWISSHDRYDELMSAVDALGIHDYVTLFSVGTAANMDIVDQCWDIPALEAEYQAFVSRYQPQQERFTAALNSSDGDFPSPQHCFVRRFWLTYDFQRFPRRDPNLPLTLLPEGWIGVTARRILMGYRQLLYEGMKSFMDDVVGSNK